MRFVIALVCSDAERFYIYDNEIRARIEILNNKVVLDKNLRGGRMLHVLYEANTESVDIVKEVVKEVEQICSLGLMTARINVIFPTDNLWKASWSKEVFVK